MFAKLFYIARDSFSKPYCDRYFFRQFFFEGYGKFFGIEAYAFVNITMQGFEIYVYGKAWNLIYAELYISASYDIFDITNANFYVRIIVDLRGLTDVSSFYRLPFLLSPFLHAHKSSLA